MIRWTVLMPSDNPPRKHLSSRQPWTWSAFGSTGFVRQTSQIHHYWHLVGIGNNPEHGKGRDVRVALLTLASESKIEPGFWHDNSQNSGKHEHLAMRETCRSFQPYMTSLMEELVGQGHRQGHLHTVLSECPPDEQCYAWSMLGWYDADLTNQMFVRCGDLTGSVGGAAWLSWTEGWREGPRDDCSHWKTEEGSVWKLSLQVLGIISISRL